MPTLRSALLLAVLTVVLLPAAVSAHPFGDPQRLEISGDGDRGVQVRWSVGGTDDLTLLGIALGVLPEDRVMLDGAVIFEESDDEALAEAPELVDYVEQRITVSQGGEPCVAEAMVAEDLAADGVDVAYACPEPVREVSVAARMLTDLHPAYRTLAEGPDGQRAVYDAGHETADWSLEDGAGPAASAVSLESASETSPGQSAALQLSLVGGGILLVGAAGTVWHRRRGRAS